MMVGLLLIGLAIASISLTTREDRDGTWIIPKETITSDKISVWVLTEPSDDYCDKREVYENETKEFWDYSNYEAEIQAEIRRIAIASLEAKE